MNEIRLQLALAKAGLASRRHAEELIVAGRVSVNGRVVSQLGSKVDPVSDRVTVDGNPVLREAPAYYLMNKPKGYVTTAEDPEGRLTVFSLLNATMVRVFSVGRLDYNTEGALLLTNDGELAHALMHPSRGVAKVYHAKFRGLIDKEQLSLLRRGVDLPPARPLDKDGKPLPTMKGSDKPERSAPAQVTIISSTGRHSWLQFILHEGKNRQIHRMAEAVGSSLLKLLRVEYAGLSLMDLPVGEYRPLQGREVLELRQSVGLRPFATQEGPVKPKVKPEAEEAPEPRSGDRRQRDESGGRSMPGRPPRPSSARAGDADSRRPAWQKDRPSARDGGESRGRPAFGGADRGAAPSRPQRAEWTPDRPSARDGGQSRERPAFGGADRGAAPIRPRRAEWSQDRPSSRDGGESRERPAFGGADRGAAPIRPQRAEWSPDRPSARDGGQSRERPAFGGADRGAAPIRPRRAEWSQDRPSTRDGGQSRERPPGSERGDAPARSSRPAWSPDRPGPREGSGQRERPAGSDRSAPTGGRSPRPAYTPDRPAAREGSGQRERPATGPAGRGAFPPRPRRPEWSQDRPSSREGSDLRDRPAASPSSSRPTPAARPPRAPFAHRSEPRDLPHDWPPR